MNCFGLYDIRRFGFLNVAPKQSPALYGVSIDFEHCFRLRFG